jgi:REP element-mobilizing transposase RayT
VPQSSRRNLDDESGALTCEVQRANNRQDVSFVDEDRRVYLELLQEQAGKYDVAILAYCIMGNHVPLVAVPHKRGKPRTASAP